MAAKISVFRLMLRTVFTALFIHTANAISLVTDLLDVTYSGYRTDQGYSNYEFSDTQTIDLLLGKSSCEIQALSPILPTCIEGGVSALDSSVRRRIAVQLSLCEFRASRVAYPSQCDTTVSDYDLDLCVVSLERHPQHWTTFSGNYREVQTICHQQALPYEKIQIVEIYQNVTQLYQSFQAEMTYSNRDSKEAMDSMRKQFESMLETLSNLHKQQQKFQYEDSVRSASRSQDMDTIWHNALELFERQHKSHEYALSVTHQTLGDISQMLFDLRDNIGLSTEVAEMLQSKISGVLATWESGSEKAFLRFQEVVSVMNSAIVNTSVGVDELSAKIKLSQDLAILNNEILGTTNTELKQHRKVVVDELEQILQELSLSADSHLKRLLRENELVVKRFIDGAMSNMTEAFNNTNNLLNEHRHIIEQLTIKFADTTRLVSKAVQKVTRALPVMAVRRISKTLSSLWSKTSTFFNIVQYGAAKITSGIFLILVIWGMTLSTGTFILASRVAARCIRFLAQLATIISILAGISAAYAVVSIVETWEDTQEGA